MGYDINYATFTGHLGANPQVRYFESGKNVTNADLAVGGRNDSTMWIRIEAWDKTGDILANAHKGDELLVMGEVGLAEWTSKTTGEKRSQITLTVNKFKFLTKKGDRPASAPARNPTPASTSSAADEEPAYADIPF